MRRKMDKDMQPAVKSRVTSRLATLLIVVMIVAPALLSLVFIVSYGVNCVYMDQWEIVPLFDKLHTGTLSFNDLIAQHNEHRPLLPRLAMLGMGSLTHYNTIAEMYLSWALMCLVCLILFKLFTSSFGFSKISMARFIPVPWLVFSLKQYENMLWGFELVHFMVILFFLLAVYLLAQSRRLH